MCIDFSGSGGQITGGRFAPGEGQNAPFEAVCILLFFNVIFWGILSDIILLYLGDSVQDLAIISCLKCCYSRCNLAKPVKGGVLPHSTLLLIVIIGRGRRGKLADISVFFTSARLR